MAAANSIDGTRSLALAPLPGGADAGENLISLAATRLADGVPIDAVPDFSSMNSAILWEAVSPGWNPGIGVPGAVRAPADVRAGDSWQVGNTSAISAITVLVVTDNEPIRDAMADALGEFGMRVVVCRDAGEGLGAFGLLDGPAVLVTDADLGGLSGSELAEAFCDAHRDGAVVLATSPLAALQPTMPDNRRVVLRKPFGARELHAAVCRAAALASR